MSGVLGVRLRPADMADAAGIAEVHRLSRASYYGVPPGPAGERDGMWRELLGQPGRSTLVAESASGTRGFMSSITLDGPDRELELTALYVLPDDFGSGVGAALHAEFRQELGTCRNGRLEVWAGNRRAIDFYVRRGWRATSGSRPGPQGISYVTYLLER